jgi:hypothetical protein
MVGDHIGYFDEGDLVFMGSGIPHVWINDQQYMAGEAGIEADAIVIHFSNCFLGDKFLDIPEMENFKNVLNLSSRGLTYNGETKKKINVIMILHM